jgi:endonuclease YncB( thermonuclease family)
MFCRNNADGSDSSARNSAWRQRWRYALSALLLLVPLASHGAREITSYVMVEDDATLKMSGYHLRLAGIYIPSTTRFCDSRLPPPRCGSRAALALRFISRGFITCRLGSKYSDGTIAAYCRTEFRSYHNVYSEYDLGMYLIDRGWAVALPDAPFVYHVSERIARSQGVGVWGFNID